MDKTKSLTKTEAKTLVIGTRIFCTVHGAEGWTMVLGIRPRDGYLKINGCNAWCPFFNFSLTDTQGEVWK